ncbi:MAG TPA: prolyl oligopeptidase family serine peptidase [Thermoanaerobaculia bacterium]|nr:prolyl oligopeptidase family serine peptidase [Thermoanaerobaculia bacterium]
MLALLLATALSTYRLPPKEIVEAFDARPLPEAILSPSRTVLALTERRAQPTIAELSRPMLRLAGARIDPKTYGPHRNPLIDAITLKKIADGSEIKVMVPANANLSFVKFSDDGSKLSFVNTTNDDLELWVASTSTGRAARAAAHLNATAGDPCDWLRDNATLVCKFVPAGRGPAPAEPAVPSGPNVLESDGKVAQVATYEDMLENAHDEDLFDYYFTSLLGIVRVRSAAIGRPATGEAPAAAPVGKPGIYAEVSPSPNGRYLLITRIKRPFSHFVPYREFPQSIEVWNGKGNVVKQIADKPSREGVPLTGVETGPRAVHWRPDAPATLIWAEALDGGDLKNEVPFRDRIVYLEAPFTQEPTEAAKTEWRFTNVQFTEKGVVLVSEFDRPTRKTRTWIFETGLEPRKIWERKQDAAYSNPGTPVTRKPGAGGFGGGFFFGERESSPILQYNDSIYLIGQGASREGDRPFLDRLNLKTLETERLFRSAADAYQMPIAPLTDDASQILTRRETPKDPPNYWVGEKQITFFKDPQPMFRGVTKQYVTYKRNDGVTLSATLYLPPNYKEGEKLPVIMWAYPREFGDADSASQVSGSPNRFLIVNGYSHLFLLLSGYAIFDNPTMPIIGPGETANDHYVEQLVASAQAAIDKVVDMGVGDRDRVGIGGHSYGAFMTANLLAHSRLFRAGFAESGAYNRTLTPFGFQSERRTFWEVPEVYEKMSPFFYANEIKDPILLMHGEADDNSGTFPIQSERLYMALKGHGATVRYVTLPDEAHGYAARETLLDVLAERIHWFDKYVKNAAPRQTAAP